MIEGIQDILVLTDMDNTLLTRNKQLTKANIATIQLFTTMGGRFAVSTGRVAESVSGYTEILDCMVPCITSGGCILYDFKDNRALINEIMPRVVAKRVVGEVIRRFPQLGIMVNGADGGNYVLRSEKHLQTLFYDEHITYFLRPFEDLPPDWNKILFAGPKSLLEDVKEYVARQNYPGLYFVYTASNYFELLPLGVNKGTAVEQLCTLLHIPVENTIVIGDYYNDIDMMQVAGYKVAMGNAPKEIKALADEITGDCDESGVGQYLYKLIEKYEKK